MFEDYKGKRVLVTGHTGFKGSWLCEMLLTAGAEVYGYALKPPTNPSLFNQLQLARRIRRHKLGDVRDLKGVSAFVRAAQPDFIFHLAAQPLVRESYRKPLETFETNVMGTANVLEAVRRWNPEKTVSVVCITTDKVYENDNSGRAFSENDPLGGSDPYSASKGACEIVIASYRKSFFGPSSNIRVASARAGNVIGGGDWAKDRLVPDAMRAFFSGARLTVRNCRSTRPWQHVLEPLAGYLMLGEALSRDVKFATAFNFGPDPKSVKSVAALVSELVELFPCVGVDDLTDSDAPAEATRLTLDSTKARRMLGWKSRWNFTRTILETSEWYKGKNAHDSARKLCQKQIENYLKS